MIIDEADHLAHYGILRKSGRYPWGSGETPGERTQTFLGTIKDLRAKGLTDTEIARGFGMTTSELRNTNTLARAAQKQADISMAQRLKDKGYSNVEIGKRMGRNESSVRSLLADADKDRVNVVEATSEMLRAEVEEKGYIDVGAGVERHLGISHEKLKAAVQLLKDEGYGPHYVPIQQLGTGKKTTVKVLAAPGTTYSEVYRNRDSIQQISSTTADGGRIYSVRQPPISIDAKRVAVRYAEQGGTDADGVIYVRPGVEDITLGKSNYAQVRIAVNGTHYLKGMAMYRDDLPNGVDLMFNTNKSNTGDKLDAMKKMKDDPLDPFGAIVRQLPKLDANGREIQNTVRSAMNIVNEQGSWEKWSKTLSTQMLSKQPKSLAKTQLDMAYDRKQREFEEIMSLTNPVVKRRLLEGFADDADASSVHLKAAAMPRQASHVILPINSLRENEVFAPNYKDGDNVVLVRYPHGGIFEIPELKVNNRNREARRIIGINAPDAIGINSKVAERLSGADFDGDSVLVIPNPQGRIKTEPALEGLKGFDPQRSYPGYEGMTRMDARTKGIEMGKISNLITDMTIKGATSEEKARAVRHSMVVIDAEKHGLNWKQSAIDNGIPALVKKYQGNARGSQGGASTLISRATSELRVPERNLRRSSEGGPIDPATGRLVYVETGAKYPNGNPKTVKSTKLAETDDANTLSSGTPIEALYASHSNRLKELANRARKETLSTPNIERSPSAATAYAREVESLTAKLNLALRNAPLERQAQILANAVLRQKREANPDLEGDELKREKFKVLEQARIRTGAQRSRIDITDQEWAAIQAGAISTSRLNQILNNTDLDKIKERATPRTRTLMSSAMKNQALALLRNGYTQAEVAEQLGVSVSTLKASLSESE